MLYTLTAILSGAFIASQSSCNGLLFPALGIIGVGFISQSLNALTIFLYQLMAKGRFPSFKGIPPYATLGGITGVFVIGFTGLCVNILGTAVTVCLSVAGQLIMSAVTDHYGWLGAKKVPFNRLRLLGFALIIAGIFIINSAGLADIRLTGSYLALTVLLLLAVILGCFTVITRMLSFLACQYAGLLNGSLANVAVGGAASFILYLAISGFRLDLAAFTMSNPAGYLTGPLGALACVLNTVVYDKLKIFKATILIIIGQLGTGILTDLFLIGSLPPGKLAGIAVVCMGIAVDKRLTRQ